MAISLVRVNDVFFNADRFESAAVVHDEIENTYGVFVYLQGKEEPIAFKGMLEKKVADNILFQIIRQCEGV